MTITEYIKQLEHLRELHGDLPVVVECVPLSDEGGEIEYENSLPSIARVSRGHLVFSFSPNYSTDLPKVVWV